MKKQFFLVVYFLYNKKLHFKRIVEIFQDDYNIEKAQAEYDRLYPQDFSEKFKLFSNYDAAEAFIESLVNNRKGYQHNARKNKIR